MKALLISTYLSCTVLFSSTFTWASDLETQATQYLSQDLPNQISDFEASLKDHPITIVSEGEFVHFPVSDNIRARQTVKKDGERVLNLIEVLSNSPGTVEVGHGFNGKYYFELKKNQEKTNWLLGQYQVNQGEDPAQYKLSTIGEPLVQSVNDAVYSLSRIALQDKTYTSTELLSLPGFQISDFRQDSPEGVTTVAFSYLYQDSTTKEKVLSKCTLTVSVQNGCPTYEVTEDSPLGPDRLRHYWRKAWKRQASNLYTTESKRELTRHEKSGATTGFIATATSTVNSNAIPVKDFTLSAYGLPEPPGIEWPKPTPLYVWLLLASGILGVVALGSRWLLKRRARNIVPTPPGV